MKARAVRRGRRSKYGAVRTTVDGIRFASKREAKRYGELKLLERAGKIAGLTNQPRFDITILGSDGKFKDVAEYVADFGYVNEQGETTYEDVKGFKTPVYRLKKKLVEAQYGITITEV